MARLLAMGFLLLSFWQQAFAQFNTRTWMHDIYGPRPDWELRNVMIPGTHDTGTDQMSSNSRPSSTLEGILKIAPRSTVLAWSKTQDRSMLQQLEDGIRYFDLRVEKTPEGWMTYHGLLSNPLRDMLEDLADFLAAHPREIILLDFQSLVNFNGDMTELFAYFQNHPGLGSRIATSDRFGSSVRLGELWNADKNLILLSNQRQVRLADGRVVDSSLAWPRVLQSPWSNTRHTAKVEEDLVNGIRQRPNGIFYVSQAVLTPDANVVTTGWTRGINSLRDMALKWMNPKLSYLIPRLHSEARQAGKYVNIIIADFYEHSPMVELCLKYNQENSEL